MRKIYFVSGIDTDCGKTYITGHIAKELRNKGLNVITQKIAQTGSTGISDDISEHRRIMGIPLTEEDIKGITCRYVFELPASPHLSAKLEYRQIDISQIYMDTLYLASKYDVVLVEGVGGLMVPLTDNFLVLDFIKKYNIPLILISSSKLGSLNHTFLSIEVCRFYELPLYSVIYNIFPATQPQISTDSYYTIKNYMQNRCPQVGYFDSNEISDLADLMI